MHKKSYIRKILKVVFLTVVFNAIILFVGYKIDLFPILETTLQENGSIMYSISNSNLMFIVTLCILNVIVIYHNIISDTINEVNDGVKKVEVHLINYNGDSIKFEHLSAIEREIGVYNQNVHNEIWVLTNNFEEKEDTIEGEELRAAIISNLKTNVDYYYIVPNTCVQDILLIGEKLQKKRITKKLTGKFHYIVDDSLDFMPTPYYDIIIYLKFCPGQSGWVETSSQIYYCFSRSTKSEDCLYQKIDRDKDELTWNKIMEHTKKYKKEKANEFKKLF